MHRVEISDLIARWDPETGERLPVRRTTVLDALHAARDAQGVRVARRLPATKDILDEDAVDELLLRVHAELQRLTVEMRHGERVASMLRPIVDAIRGTGIHAPIRVVDIGCGLGYVVRWLAAHKALGDHVELVGCDINATLVDEADRLAVDEGLDCEFLHADAFALSPATVYISTGVLHHFRGRDLVDFFAAQARAGVIAVCHFDVAPTPLAPIGSWIFHWARMREPLSRHDGVVSALWAHPDEVLVRSARRAMPGFRPLLFDPVGLRPAVLTVLHPVLAIRPGFVDAFRAGLGERAHRLVAP